MNRRGPEDEKPLRWVGSSKRDLAEMPGEVRRDFGHALWMIQAGETPPSASPFDRSSGANVMKLTENLEGDTYRCVYTAKLAHAVYVLHIFIKKSKSGIATPAKDVELVYRRLDAARADHRAEFGDQ
jgi:phage-related protein